MRKRTKIIATIGPATSSPAMIARLIRAGMDVVRLNFSHGDRKAHSERIRLVRREAKRLGRHIAIIQDLQGPKLRVGRMKNDAVLLERGASVTLTTKNVVGTKQLISITYPRLTGDLKPNDTVLLDDGRLALTVMERGRDTIECLVVRGGVLKSHKGVNMPGARLTLPVPHPSSRMVQGAGGRCLR